VTRIVLENPWSGYDEVERLIDGVESSLLGVSDVVVNMTGGTSLLCSAFENQATLARQK
jgi:hypothetical protein